jgi:hypothetical protein
VVVAIATSRLTDEHSHGNEHASDRAHRKPRRPKVHSAVTTDPRPGARIPAEGGAYASPDHVLAGVVLTATAAIPAMTRASGGVEFDSRAFRAAQEAGAGIVLFVHAPW